jgi:glycerophosphoryl diester phosphodiesterase
MPAGGSKAMRTVPLLLGHRGTRGNPSVPENTLAAFDLALAQGCDGFEFDVRLDADGQAGICHNARVRGLEVAMCCYQKLGLPRLRDVLQRYHKEAFLDIELKVEGLERSTLDSLHEYPPARGYVVSSFLPEVLKTIHSFDATASLGLICDKQAQFSLWPAFPVEYLVLHHKLARRNVIAQLQAEHRKVLVWTVNSVADMMRFAEWKVDGIISDHPKKLAATLGETLTTQK